MLTAIAGSVFTGLRSGFVRRLAGLIFLGVSFVAGSYLRTPAGALLHGFFPKIPMQYVEMVGYSVVFSALLLAFNLFSGVILSRVAVSGVSKAMDRGLGAVFGGAESILLISAAIVIVHTYTDPTNSLSGLKDLGVLHDLRLAVDESTIGKFLEKTTVPVVLTVLGPLLPTDIKSVVSMAIPGGIPGFPIPGGIPGLPTPTPTPH
jgi:uncharacterized membrane protein required for colicin V production